MRKMFKYVQAIAGMAMLRALLIGRRAEFRSGGKLGAYNVATDEVNKVLRRFGVYDETYWIVWLATGMIEIPTFQPDPEGTVWMPREGWCRIEWTAPRMFKPASAW